jgi:hypothetical protein
MVTKKKKMKIYVASIYFTSINGDREDHIGYYATAATAWKQAVLTEYERNKGFHSLEQAGRSQLIERQGDPVRYKELRDLVAEGAVVDDAFLEEWKAARATITLNGRPHYGSASVREHEVIE